MNINLDDIGGNNQAAPEQKPATASSAPAGDLGLVFVGSKTPDTKSNTPAASRSIGDIYQEHQKMVYMIDISGSMGEVLAGSQQVSHFLWSKTLMQQLRDQVAAAVARCTAEEKIMEGLAEGLYTEDTLPEYTEPTGSDRRWAELDGLEDEEFKAKLLQLGLQREVYIPMDYTNEHAHKDLDTKMSLVKKMTKQMVEERKAKFPASQIEVITFDNTADVLRHNGTAESIAAAISTVEPRGGTSIVCAVEAGMKNCKRRPSTVGLHHFILVTDGEDWGASELPNWIPSLKEHGVVFDFIWIAQPGETLENSHSAKAIKAVCDATGGTFTIVTTAEEFKTKFVAASTRLMLPPSSK